MREKKTRRILRFICEKRSRYITTSREVLESFIVQ